MTATGVVQTHSNSHASSAEVRARLNHPVVDCDGHMLEHVPVFLDFLKETAGPDMVEHWLRCSREGKSGRWYALTPEERRVHRPSRPPFWGVPSANTLDRATSMLPGLLRERLDELGSTSPSSTRRSASSSSTSPRKTSGAPAAGPRTRWCRSSTANTRTG